MGRLYYEKNANPLQPIAVNGTENVMNQYLEKVSKLIPSEIIAGYLIMCGFVPLVQNTNVHNIIYFIVFLLCFFLTPFYMYSQRDKNKSEINNHLIVSTVAFVIWAYATTGKTIIAEFYDAALSSIMLVAFSLISGIVPLNK